jgi:hypothetical protein
MIGKARTRTDSTVKTLEPSLKSESSNNNSIVWSEREIADLNELMALNFSIDEIVDFLRRDVEEVRRKISDLGLMPR